MKSTRRTRASASVLKDNKNKRKLLDEDEVVVAVDSGDEFSGINRSVDRDLTSSKRLKFGFKFIPEELEQRFHALDLGNRKVIPGKPLSGKTFVSCGAVKLFSDLGFESFLVDMPKDVYPDYVYEFYANFIPDQFGNYVSFVRGKKITLNVPIINCILRVENAYDLSVYTKKGPKLLNDLSALDQLNAIRGMHGIPEFCCPTTSSMIPMANLLFKICISNICPRLGSRYNLNCQDIVVVSMLLLGRRFNLSELILKNMTDVYDGNPGCGLPYGLLLTRVFDWYGVDFFDMDKHSVKEFLDGKSLQQSHLKVEKDGTLVQLEIPTPSPIAKSAIASGTDSEMLQFVKKVYTDQVVVIQKLNEVLDEIKSLRECAFGPRTPATVSAHTTRSGEDVFADLDGLQGLADASRKMVDPVSDQPAEKVKSKSPEDKFAAEDAEEDLVDA